MEPSESNVPLYRVGVVNHNNFRFQLDHRGRIINPRGGEFDLLQTLANTMKFRFSLHNSSEAWGDCWPNGSCTGLVGMMVRKEVDMLVSSFAPRGETFEVLDYTSKAHTYLEWVYVTLKERSDIPRKLFFQTPFENQVWWTLLLTTIACALFYKQCLNISNSLWIIFSIFMKQDTDVVIYRSTVRRWALGSWLVTAVVIVQLHSSVLSSTTSLFPGPLPLDTLADLVQAVKNYGYRVAVIQYSMPEVIIKRKKTLRKVRDILEVIQYEGPKVALERILSSHRLAYVLDRTLAHKSARRMGKQEHFHYSKDTFCINNVHVGFRKNLQVLERFDRAILQMVEAGFTNKWFRFSLERTHELGPNWIGQRDLFWVYAVLGLGFGAAFFVFLAELLVTFLVHRRGYSPPGSLLRWVLNYGRGPFTNVLS